MTEAYYISQCLRKIHLLRRRHLDQRMDSLGFHPSHLAVLEHINRNEGCTQVDISQNMALTPAAIALATKRLKHEGLIEKKADENNLRRNILTLTEKGREICEQTRGFFKEFDDIMYQGFEEDELEKFWNSLNKIVKNITGEETNPLDCRSMDELFRQVKNKEK